MNSALPLALLLVLMVLLLSCRKEADRCTATLHVWLDNRREELEWMEVTAGRKDSNGEIYIDATGFHEERFWLHLQPVSNTGTITDLSTRQLSYTDGLGFSTQGVQSGFIRIKCRTAQALSGSFDVYLTGSHGTAPPLRAAGDFVIYGRE